MPSTVSSQLDRKERPERMHIVAYGLTDVGLQREHNEDSFLVLDQHDLFVVADGMGGHRAGDVASRLATETLADFFFATSDEDVTWPYHFDTTMSEEENRLLTGIRIANRQIFERGSRSREFQGMGTTMVTVLFSSRSGKLYISHVGDSRCYRMRDRHLRLMTRDHSLVNDYLLAMPELTEEQRDELPRNVITRALGMQDHVVIDMQTDTPQEGDIYLLCSDGLSGMIRDEILLDILCESPDPNVLCHRLIQEANSNGGEDNITAVVLAIRPGLPTAQRQSVNSEVTPVDVPTKSRPFAQTVPDNLPASLLDHAPTMREASRPRAPHDFTSPPATLQEPSGSDEE